MHTPKMKLRHKSRLPWIDKELLRLVRKMKALRNRLKCNGFVEMTSEFKILRKETKRLISFKYIQDLKSLSDKLKTNRKMVWAFHSLKSRTKRFPEVITCRSKAMSPNYPSEKASLFNELFSTVFFCENLRLCGTA